MRVCQFGLIEGWVRHLSLFSGRQDTWGAARGRLAPAAHHPTVGMFDLTLGLERVTSLGMSLRPLPVILVDADACPVKDEVFKVAARHGVKTYVVSNSFMRVPADPMIERVVVAAGLDVADDWIAERSGPHTVVVTADIPLAARAIKAGATVLAPNGRVFTEQSIGNVLATRNLMDDLRSAGVVTSGPPPFQPKDRSAFLSALHMVVTRVLRAQSG